MINLDAFHNIIAAIQGKTLVAVSKFKPYSSILELYKEGHRDFGENYVQELVDKYNELPKDIQWHFIGHLQRNKVKFIAPFIHLIQSVDSFKLLQEIQKEALKNERNISVLLQIYVGDEDSKYGLDATRLMELLEYYTASKNELSNVNIVGLMGMGSLTDDESITIKEFKEMKDLFDIVKTQYFFEDNKFSIISMGMSNDYQLAIDNGSNMIRIGSTIFGNR